MVTDPNVQNGGRRVCNKNPGKAKSKNKGFSVLFPAKPARGEKKREKKLHTGAIRQRKGVKRLASSSQARYSRHGERGAVSNDLPHKKKSQPKNPALTKWSKKEGDGRPTDPTRREKVSHPEGGEGTPYQISVNNQEIRSSR